MVFVLEEQMKFLFAHVLSDAVFRSAPSAVKGKPGGKALFQLPSYLHRHWCWVYRLPVGRSTAELNRKLKQ